MDAPGDGCCASYGSGAGPIKGTSGNRPRWGIIEGSIQPIQEDRNAMEAERINALSALLNDLTGREAELRRYL
jgi:hypothetical protein